MKAAPFSHVVPVGSIPPAGRHFRIEAGDSERRRLADSMDIPEIVALAAELDVRPVGERAFMVSGTLRATVVQTDVVTLDPLTQDMTEEIDVTLQPAAEHRGETESAPDAADEGDFYHNGRIDLGVIVGEYLALGLDPYPRAPGVDFADYLEDDPEKAPSPFAALAALKRSGD